MMKQNKNRPPVHLVLASASPRRKFLLKKHGYRFSVQPSSVLENANPKLSPQKFVAVLALKKAVSISRKIPNHVVLGADTVVYIKKKIIGKPKHSGDAQKILRELSGSWQRVYTGVAVVWNGGREKLVRSAVSYVKFRKLSEKDIARASRRHLDKAGAYSVQEKRDPFVEKISGDFDNVVGLPMKVVDLLLSRCAQHFLKTIGHHIHFKA